MSISEDYNLWANEYDLVQNKTRDLDQKATIATLSQYNFKTVLELGCGTGKNTEWLIEKAEEVTGFDFSEKMLAIAQKRLKGKNVHLKLADLTQPWQLKDGYADLVTCNLVLEHIQNLDLIFHQAYAKLKPDGLFFLSELHPFRQHLGSKAKFHSAEGLVELKVYQHTVSEYFKGAGKFGFELVELEEWWDTKEKIEVPRLLTMVFKKGG